MTEEQDKAAAESGDDPTTTHDEASDALLSEAEQVAAAVAGARPARKSAQTPAKGHATPKRTRAQREDGTKRTNPVQFIRESIEELRLVIWPTLSQVQQYFIVVLVFVLVIIAIVSVLDLVFGWALLQIFG